MSYNSPTSSDFSDTINSLIAEVQEVKDQGLRRLDLMQSQLDEYCSKIAEADAQLSSVESARDRALAQLESAKQNNENLLAEVNRLKSLRDDRQSLIDENTLLKRQVSGMDASLANLHHVQERLEGNVSSISDLQFRYDALSAKHRSRVKKFILLEKKILDMQCAYSNLSDISKKQDSLLDKFIEENRNISIKCEYQKKLIKEYESLLERIHNLGLHQN